MGSFFLSAVTRCHNEQGRKALPELYNCECFTTDSSVKIWSVEYISANTSVVVTRGRAPACICETFVL